MTASMYLAAVRFCERCERMPKRLKETMIRSDFHMHTAFSTDSEEAVESMLNRAVERGLYSVCIRTSKASGDKIRDVDREVSVRFCDRLYASCLWGRPLYRKGV